MSESFEHETFVTTNPDGSISLDAYAGKSREELKEKCRKLVRAVGEWQMIALHLAEYGKDSLSPEDRNRVETLLEAYRD
jgi:uncharacterized protein YbgA (DUF1722 family)